MQTTTYSATALLNPTRGAMLDGYIPGDDLYQSDETIIDMGEHATPEAALNAAFRIGNRMEQGDETPWPANVRSISVGDVLYVNSTTTFSGGTTTAHEGWYAVAPIGFTRLPDLHPSKVHYGRAGMIKEGLACDLADLIR